MATESVTHNEIVRLMVGRDVAADLYPARANAHVGGTALTVRNLSWPGVLHDINLEVRRGEIVGLAGLVGSGRTSVARAIFGAAPEAHGDISVAGEAVRIRSPRKIAASRFFWTPPSLEDAAKPDRSRCSKRRLATIAIILRSTGGASLSQSRARAPPILHPFPRRCRLAGFRAADEIR